MPIAFQRILRAADDRALAFDFAAERPSNSESHQERPLGAPLWEFLFCAATFCSRFFSERRLARVRGVPLIRAFSLRASVTNFRLGMKLCTSIVPILVGVFAAVSRW